MANYHTIVLGGGPGGAAAAKTIASGGKTCALISPELGGECLNYGCIPTKAYLWAVDLFEKIQSGADIGIDIEKANLNWQKMKTRRGVVVSKLKKNLTFTLERLGVKIIGANGKLLDSHTVEISSPAGTETLTSDFIVLAAGAEPIFPGDLKITDRILSNREILNLDTVPETLLIIGGGIIGVEFASVFSALGSKVTIAETSNRLLKREDPEVSAELERVFTRKEITIVKNTPLEKLDMKLFEKILVAAGRKPHVQGFGLENSGVAFTEKGVQTDGAMRTNIPNIYAVGDLAGKSMLAYTAELEGKIAANAILNKNPEPLNYGAVPSAIFSIPEVASCGINEEEAKKRGIEYVTGKGLTSANSKALIMGSRDGFAKILVDKKTGKLLGVHIIGEKASELITSASLALSLGITIQEYALNIHGHPVLSEIIKEACESFTNG